MRLTKQFLFLFILEVFVLESSTYLVTSAALDRLIKIGSIAALFVFFKIHRLESEIKIVLLLYCLLFGTALLGSFVLADFTGFLQCFKIMFLFLTFPFLVSSVPASSQPSDRLVRLPVWWAVAISVQSLILFMIIYNGWSAAPHFVALERIGGMPEASFGVWGYANALNSIREGSEILRAQSWFLEPSNLSGFMIYPTLVSFGYYQSTGKKAYLLASALCAACLGITFSLAGFIGFLAGVTVLIVIRPALAGAKRGIGAYIKSFAAVALMASGAIFLHQSLTKTSYYEQRETSRLAKVMARNPTESLLRDASRADVLQTILGSHALGVGFGGTADQTGESSSPNAFIFWTIAGGLPAALLLLTLYYRLFFRSCLPLLLSQRPHYRTVAAGFIGHTIQQLSYGTWVEPAYLFTVGAVLLCAAHQRQTLGAA